MKQNERYDDQYKTVYLCGEQYEHQNQRKVLTAEEVDLPLERRRPEPVQRQELFANECRHV